MTGKTQKQTDDRISASLPFGEPPAPGQAIEVAPGVLWMRFALPFQLDHVNIYLIEDGDGWAVVDAGIGNDETREAWRAALAGPLRGRRLTRLIVTHHHPDHIGAAGWLAREHDLPIYMSELEYMTARFFLTDPDAVHGEFHKRFYARHGASADMATIVTERGHRYMELMTGLPHEFKTLEAERPLMIGGRRFQVLKGSGHSPDQAMLYCADEGLFFAADQVLQKITPNISVHATQPDADPLARYLDSLASIRAQVPDGVLTLPGHRLPMTALHARVDELAAHHVARCDELATICAKDAISVSEITPLLFRRELDAHQMSFAFAEALAHVNYMVGQGRLKWVDHGNDQRVRTV